MLSFILFSFKLWMYRGGAEKEVGGGGSCVAHVVNACKTKRYSHYASCKVMTHSGNTKNENKMYKTFIHALYF